MCSAKQAVSNFNAAAATCGVAFAPVGELPYWCISIRRIGIIEKLLHAAYLYQTLTAGKYQEVHLSI